MTNIGTNYGEALYSLALEEGLDSSILQQLTSLAEAISQEPDYLKLLGSHNLTKQERYGIIDSGLKGAFHPYVLNFLKILVEKGYVKYYPQCVDAYRACYNRDRGIVPVRVVSAAALTQEQIARLTEKLSALTGKTVALSLITDPQCLGGIRLDYDGKQVDDTVAHRLESIRAMLKTTVL